MSTSVFDVVEMAPDDPILGLNEAFKTDPRKEKVNLSIGVYCTEEGKVPLLKVVEQTEKKLAEAGAPHTYLPISGIPAFTSGVQKLIFGPDSEVVKTKRAATVQSLGGTGALKVGADFLATVLKNPEAVVSAPTWQNHVAIFESAGFKVGSYPYYDKKTGEIDFPAMLETLKGLKKDTVVILHACCHNPTGVDLTQEQWAQVVDVCRDKGLIPFLDIAYQGFGAGLNEDAGSIRQFADSGIPFFVSNSFSKSFSLYGERIGALTVVCKSEEEAKRVNSKLKSVIRANYSNPPAHGAKIVSAVLNDPELLQQWHEDLKGMRERIKEMRHLLAEALKKEGAKVDFSFIENQNGMFSFSRLTPEQVQRLKDEFGVYAVKSGRICVASLNKANVDYTAKAIKEVL
ncbi:amino acid aminotransferase [uncultured Turicimonas sp.]|uniref:amino acid aminotransferase n=1 Tax=uncultured Turicimonas sp. TaxID=1918607 RepID=UPI002806573F|nr:amino acid aminotransferase [uncultured Turicimonas sp.]